MTQHDRHFDKYKPHTLLKHQILDSYISAWAHKLLMSSPGRPRLAVVDAFAGEGGDKEGHAGSPIIAARRANQAMQLLNATRGANPVSIDVFAIEQRAQRIADLKATIATTSEIRADLVHPLHGELAEHIDEILAYVGDGPTFLPGTTG